MSKLVANSDARQHKTADAAMLAMRAPGANDQGQPPSMITPWDLPVREAPVASTAQAGSAKKLANAPVIIRAAEPAHMPVKRARQCPATESQRMMLGLMKLN